MSEAEDAGADADLFAAARSWLHEYLHRHRGERFGALPRFSPRLAVAFSGGVDSAALLHLAIDELGGDNVLALHAKSILSPPGHGQKICDRMLADFSRRCQVRQVDFFPLAIAGFAENSPERCYLCKKSMYGEFLRLARDYGVSILADGTNADDDVASRPGWRAIQELEVIAPLRAADISKAAIRDYARCHGLINHALPSQSCLATRFASGLPIDEAALRLVARLEARLGEELQVDFRLRLAAAGWWGIEVRGAASERPDSVDEATIRRCCNEYGLELAYLSFPDQKK